MNQTIEQYLRAYVNYEQDDWTSHLPMAQYVYNNAENEKTKMMLFFANYGYNLTIMGLYPKESLSLTAIENAKKLKGLHKQLKDDVEFLNLTIGRYYNQKHEDVPPWKEGNKVYL